MNKKIIFSILGIVIVGVALFFTILNSNITPLVNVKDQSISNNQVFIDSAIAIAPSWLVIQTEANGVPGPVIGYVKINKGENSNISVKINATEITPKLFAMIHEDGGEKNKFDFPENDMPLIYKGEMVSKLFVVK